MEKESQMSAPEPVNPGLTPAESPDPKIEAYKAALKTEYAKKESELRKALPPPPGLTKGEATAPASLMERMAAYLEDADCECDKSTGHVCESCSLLAAILAPKAPPELKGARECYVGFSDDVPVGVSAGPRFTYVRMREVQPTESPTPQAEVIPDQWCPNCEYLMEDKPTPTTMGARSDAAKRIAEYFYAMLPDGDWRRQVAIDYLADGKLPYPGSEAAKPGPGATPVSLVSPAPGPLTKDGNDLAGTLSDVLTYIEGKEDLRPYSALTKGKGLHTRVLFHLADISKAKPMPPNLTDALKAAEIALTIAILEDGGISAETVQDALGKALEAIWAQPIPPEAGT